MRGAKGVESAQPHRINGFPDEGFQPLAHFVGSLVSEGASEEAMGGDALRQQQVSDAVGEHSRLATARACEDQDGTVRRRHHFSLLLIQFA
jgi:hypothetical protein